MPSSQKPTARASLAMFYAHCYTNQTRDGLVRSQLSVPPQNCINDCPHRLCPSIQCHQQQLENRSIFQRSQSLVQHCPHTHSAHDCNHVLQRTVSCLHCPHLECVGPQNRDRCRCSAVEIQIAGLGFSNNLVNSLSKSFERTRLDSNICNKDSGVPKDDRKAQFSDIVKSSGWYYGQLSWQDAQKKLKNCQEGTFLLRDSSDKRYIFALSVQTNRGPTSVRIIQNNNGFSFDSDAGSEQIIFPTIFHLLQHYIAKNRRHSDYPIDPYCRTSSAPREHVWLDSSGSVVASINLTRPCRQKVPTLKHFARLKVNAIGDNLNVSSLPRNLHNYLEMYPFPF